MTLHNPVEGDRGVTYDLGRAHLVHKAVARWVAQPAAEGLCCDAKVPGRLGGSEQRRVKTHIRQRSGQRVAHLPWADPMFFSRGLRVPDIRILRDRDGQWVA